VETIKTKKLQYLEHVIRGKRCHAAIDYTGQNSRQKKLRKAKNIMAAQLSRMVRMHINRIFRAAASKFRIAAMLFNLLREDGK